MKTSKTSTTILSLPTQPGTNQFFSYAVYLQHYQVFPSHRTWTITATLTIPPFLILEKQEASSAHQVFTFLAKMSLLRPYYQETSTDNNTPFLQLMKPKERTCKGKEHPNQAKCISKLSPLVRLTIIKHLKVHFKYMVMLVHM